MTFISQVLVEEGSYNLYKHETVAIPSFDCNAEQMITFLESMFSFKVIYTSLYSISYIIDSLLLFLEGNN